MWPACSWRNIHVDSVSAPTREEPVEGFAEAALFPEELPVFAVFEGSFFGASPSGGAAASVFSRKSTSSGEPR
jgi:hypothetical protein